MLLPIDNPKDNLSTDFREYIIKFEPDVWSIQACGKIDENDVGGLYLPSFVKGRNNPGPGNDEPYTQIRSTPGYLPYESARIATNETGWERSRLALNAVFSEDMLKLFESSPLTKIALLTSATVIVEKTKVGEWLKEAGTAIPRKGDEIKRLWPAYQIQCSGNLEAAIPMMLRDFSASSYVWVFIRIRDVRIHDLGGSMMCLTIASDYYRASDDPGTSDMKPYMEAMNEGLSCLEGPAASVATRDAILCSGFIQVRDAVNRRIAGMSPGELQDIISAYGGVVTPREFITMRWWDAAMSPYYRSAMGSDGYYHLTESSGVFKGTKKCGKIRRAIDSSIRYNEIVDLLPDATQGDGTNELLIAMLVGGHEATSGYAGALSAIIDEALTCDCGAEGHVEAAEIAMGSCLWFALVPRYNLRSQLNNLVKGNPTLMNAFAFGKPGERHIMCKTLPGDILHTDGWKPLWTKTFVDIPELVQRVVRRTLPEEVRDEEVHLLCNHMATTVLIACFAIDDDLEQLRELWSKWCDLFDAAVSKFMQENSPLLFSLRNLIGRIWIHTIIGTGEVCSDTSESLFVDIDKALRETYQLSYENGRAIRRAFHGVVSSAIELSGFNPYACLADGAAHLCRK
ncbi:hypothetical protein [Chitinophaga solisilvae]|uniref:hypothetical protein n=1 Tax=Chitinophaga solisilvae TaxID=1233460 RepID=UPI00136B4539|nr:hypothetical protein [Chitinophaga solisilvae]